MTDSSSSFGSRLGKKAMRVVVAIVGLLLLRAVLSSLPMLKNASYIGGTFLTPGVLANAIIDTLILAAIFGFGLGASGELRQFYPKSPHLGQAVLLLVVLLVLVLAYYLYELPIACVLISPQSVNVAAGTTADTLDTWLKPYMLQNHTLYTWIFLLLAAIPVAGLVLIGARNLEAVSDLLFHKATSVGAGQGHEPEPPSAGPRMQATMPAAAGTGAGADLSPESMEKLMRLKTLLDQHAITQADFDAQKRAILQGTPAQQEPAELQRLKQLLNAGVLTQEEYDSQRKGFMA
ncbi:MAG: SHOCT domain-containing protein [Bryobacteraceae bacterium]|jgi:hypothetical protein